jgi:hypothetical protein
VHHGCDIFELLKQRSVFIGERMVIKLLGKLFANSCSPASHLVVNDLNVLLSQIDLVHVGLQHFDFGRKFVEVLNIGVVLCMLRRCVLLLSLFIFVFCNFLTAAIL